MSPRRRAAHLLAWTALAWAPLLLWFAAFKPGIMSADSLGSWWQASTGNVSDDITPSYTALMKLSLVLTDSPSALAIGQQLLLASAFVAVAAALVHLGVHRWLVIACTAVLLCTPMVGAFSISLWKDIPYSAALLYCGAALVWLLARRNAGQRTARELAGPLTLLLVAGCAAVVLRQNGVFFTGALGGILFVSLKGARRWVFAGTACTGLVLVLLKSALYPLAGVDPSAEQLKYASLLHDVGAVVHHQPAALDADDRAELAELAPIEQWSRNYSCYTVNPLYYGANMRFESLAEDPAAFRAVWQELVLEEPATVLGHRVCAASIAWRPMAVDRRISVLYTVSNGIDPNGDGLATTPLWSDLNRLGRWLIGVVNNPSREWYLWRAPTWIYACYVALAVAAVRNRSALLLLPGAALLAQQLGVAVLNPAQDARYMMGSLMLAVLLLPLATVKLRPAVAAEPAPPPPRDNSVDPTEVHGAPDSDC